MPGPRPCSIAAILLLSACDRGAGSTTRALEVRGLPTCPGRSTYARPIVVRVDRERSLFDEPFTTQTRVDAPATVVAISLPRTRMRVTVRVGLCASTSVGTWDCAAATWLGSANADLDARASAASLMLPTFEAPCTVAPR